MELPNMVNGIEKTLANEDAALRTMLKPLWSFLNYENLVELSVIRPGEVGLEIANLGYQFIQTPELDYEYWYLLCQVLANKNGIDFHIERQPRISVALPGGHRFEAMLGKIVEGKLSVSIRIKRKITLVLEDFGLSKEFSGKLIQLVANGSNIIVSGGTSSGKTTFLNLLFGYIPPETRILTVEDTRELDIPHLNQKNYVVSRNEANPVIGYPEIIDHLVRSRPDMIIAGEVSVANAFPILRMLNSGHAGFMSTVHANSPELALSAAFPQNIRLSGIETHGITELLYQTIDAVIQLHRVQGKREVTQILFPKTKENIFLDKEESHVQHSILD